MTGFPLIADDYSLTQYNGCLFLRIGRTDTTIGSIVDISSLQLMGLITHKARDNLVPPHIENNLNGSQYVQIPCTSTVYHGF